MTEPITLSDKQQRRKISRHIAAKLNETEVVALKTIEMLVYVLGEDRALAMLTEAQQVEANGGLTTSDGQSRRSPGGTYFKLVKDQITPQERRRIFAPPKKNKARSQPPDWGTLATMADILLAQASHGEADKVKLTVVGRPGKIIEKESVVMITMQSSKAPSLPKELPPLPPKLTTYLVLIDQKQWRKVREAIKSVPTDKLIVDGYPVFNPQISGGTLCLYAQSVTTTGLQQSRTTAQKPV